MESTEIAMRLERVEHLLTRLVEREMVKEHYTTKEFAELVGRSELTVRDWCRLGRISAKKQRSGRGAFLTWVIARKELERFREEGLLRLRNKCQPPPY